jgi:CRP/FNR family transcriptional regulator
MDKLEILRQLSFYKLLLSNRKREIENAATYMSIEENRLLFIEGDSCKGIGFLGKGNIRVSKMSETGREITLYHVQPGEACVLNISCAFSNVGYPATATIENTVEMVIFPSVTFREWMAIPEVRSFVFELFSKRLAQVITLVEEIVFRKMDQRLAEFLTSKFDNKGKPRRILRMTQEKIAAEMGTAREVVNRLLKEFERLGAIENARGVIKLQNESRLKEYYQSN